MISVIIPTLNEEDNIASVIQFAKAQPYVTEVIVVDDKSQDKTVAIAHSNQAKVVTSTKLGKGASMKDGVLCAKNDIVVFLDGDIDPYPHFIIKLLTDPILQDEVDFVNSSFIFFQAEDGIRDWSVTGVQTCALPIYLHSFPIRDWSVTGVQTCALPI